MLNYSFDMELKKETFLVLRRYLINIYEKTIVYKFSKIIPVRINV